MAILGQTEGPSCSSCGSSQTDAASEGGGGGEQGSAGAQNTLPASKYLQILIVLDDEQLQGHPEPQLWYVHQYHLHVSCLCQRQTLKVWLCSLPEGEQVVGKTGSEILSSPVYLQNYICHKTYMTVQTTPKTTSRIFQIMCKCSAHELHCLTGTTRSGNQCLFLKHTPNIYHSLLP